MDIQDWVKYEQKTKMSMGRVSISVWLVFVSVLVTNAQLVDKKGIEVNPYYISFDYPTPPIIEDVRGEYLHISFMDRIGQSENVLFSIKNAKNELVRELNLIKQLGQNYFDIQLADHGITLDVEAFYTVTLKIENGEKRERTIRYISKVKTDIAASIVVHPKFLSCEDATGSNLVEFFGQVSGGKAPYKANWYVLNAHKTDFLYQPARMEVPIAGMVSSVRVDKTPAYFVMLYVIDACGNEQTTTVQVICEKNKKKVNTVFFEKLDDALLKKVEMYK